MILLWGGPGDNDPLDAIEIGDRVLSMGEVTRVKVLCYLALQDQNETDHKIIVISTDDEKAKQINS